MAPASCDAAKVREFMRRLGESATGPGRDVQAMFRRGLVLPAELEALFAAIGPDIVRYPAVDAPSLGRKVRAAMDVPAP